MKSFRRWSISALVLAAAVAALHGELAHIEGSSPLEAVFFKLVPLGPESVPARRPPAETRPELSKLIAGSPNDGDLYSLRALEAEQQLDFAAAEADWTRYAQLARDRFAGQTALADYYQRRVEPAKELTALHAAAVLPGQPSDRFAPASEQRSWKTFERITALIDDHLLGYDAARNEHRAWIARYPNEPAAYSRILDYAVAHKQYEDASRVLKQYAAAFPSDASFQVEGQAKIEAARGSTQDALVLYDRSFKPLWPPELVKAYFELLTRTGSLRRYLQEARAKGADIDGAARIFYYWQQQGNLANAQRALIEFEARKSAGSWKPDELWTLGQLYEAANDSDRAARCYYSLYSQNGATARDAERALAAIATVLFSNVSRGIRFGSSDLSYYRDIAQADPYPGYLNGILSLILNTTGPSYEYSQENQQAQAYFHRARASELVSLFDSRFPNSPRRTALHARRIEAFSLHGDSAAVIHAGTQFRTQFPNAAERTQVATLMADAYARTNQTRLEFALYDELLQELARRSEGVPLGEHAGPFAAQTQQSPEQQAKPGARSLEYARILDRYLARLAGMKRIPDALALYRREIDRNPNDPGLYERFAAFLEQNRLGAEVEATYKRAMAQFPDASWSHKLARWYLRQKQTAQYAQLTRDVVTRFSGTQLESYFSEAMPRASVGAALYLQLNLYAHQRFPNDLTFTRNLLSAYTTRGTADAAAYESLLRANWFYADDLRMRFFEYLSRTRRLKAELAALGKVESTQQVNENPAAARMLADGEAWQTHYEAAAPVYRAIAASYPAAAPTAQRAAAIYRSLATIDPRQTDVAANIEQALVSYSPGDSSVLTYAGEIQADRERFDRARPLWNRIVAIEPGKAERYLETATIFWDYFLFDDALRVIDEGRRKLADTSLYAYQAGAIYENKRQYGRALGEYANAALNQSSDEAQRRLVRLARRATLRSDVERLTTNAVNQAGAGRRALGLRAAVLNNQGRRADLEQMLTAGAGRADSIEVLDWIENQGRIDGFAPVQEAAMSRRIAITADPVDQVRYQLALVHFYEDQARPADAQRLLTSIYQAHPTTLGVVRAVTDFYWRNGRQKAAVETLAGAADRAQPYYQRAFRLEAARKATEAGDTASARRLLEMLLTADRYRPEYLAAMADTYARAGDDSGLRGFYESAIESVRTSNLSAADKTERIAAMRRGLIPVLTRTKAFPAALDQYIEILNRFPEDDQLAREAASYASAHQLGDRLIAAYTKTAAASPRDSRWPIVLARIDTELEKFPEAVEAYGRAVAIRPDRTDLWTAQAAIQERLLRFADAERSYSRLYELTYHDTTWMERIALTRARQGKKDEMLAALKSAFIENRPERPDNYFSVASRLINWGYVTEARQYAEQGASVAGGELAGDNSFGAIYSEIMGRARQYETAYGKLAAGGAEPDQAPAFLPSMRLLGQAARDFYTPEEKAAFATFLEGQGGGNPRFLLVVAQAAKLEDVTVRWLEALLRTTPSDIGLQSQYAEEQTNRLRYSELATYLEQLWRITPPQAEGRTNLLIHAGEAYGRAGDAAGELRVLRARKAQGALDARTSARLCHLLVEQPQALLATAGTDPAQDMRDMAANCAIENASPENAMAAITARGRVMPPVWQSAYTGLTGLYFSITTPEIRDAFQQALGSPVIGDRIGRPFDRDRQLAGAPWFYYGARFGEYLALTKQPQAADYLPAMLEAAPWSDGAYNDLANYYRDAGNTEQAMAEYGHALELDPDNGPAHDEMAELLWTSGRKDEAVTEFKRAFESLITIQDRGPAPPGFPEDVKTLLSHVGKREVLAAVRPEADHLLKTWLRRNGTYLFEPLLQGILVASGDPAKGVAWLMNLTQSTGDPLAVLGIAARNQSLPDAQRDMLYRRLVDAYQAKLTASFGQPREIAEQALRSWQVEWLRFLVHRRLTDRASTLLRSIPAKARQADQRQLVPLEIRIAALSNALPALLDGYAGDREPPSTDVLRTGANELERAGMDAASRRVMEFVYTRELELHHFDPANFLGLAEIRLRENQTPAAAELLRRMTMLSGEPFDNHEAAAALLARFGKNAEAAVFLDQLVKAVPWNAAAREQLAELTRNTQALAAVAREASAPYTVRATAATALRKIGGASLNSGAAELDLLASTAPLTEAAVNQPYWYRARIEAASAARDGAAKYRMLLGAIATDPAPAEPRLQLFRTAMELKRFQAAIAAMPSAETQGFEEIADSTELPEWQTGAFLQNTPYTAAERAFVARGLGEAWQARGDDARALYYYRLFLEFDQSPGAHAAIQPKLDAVRSVVALKKANNLRRPVVSRNLEQPHLVRPRLSAGGAR